jgi:multidrug resistance efflux pump
LRAAEKTIQRRQADHAAADAAVQTAMLKVRQTIDADLPQVKAQELEATLAAESRVGEVHTSVLQLEAQLKTARYNLEQTTVRAPGRGYAVGVTLRPGQRVANIPLRSWMAFVNLDQSRLVASINQNALRHVQPGQPAEVTFKVFPGKVYSAVVDQIVGLNSAGQVVASGQVPDLQAASNPPQPFGVVLKLADESIDVSIIPGGASGTASVYTNTMAATHVIRKVMIRMDAWMNYIIPW